MTEILQENESKSGQANKAVYFWMGASIVLLILLIVALLFNPLQRGNSSVNEAFVASVNGVNITKDQLYDEMYAQTGQQILDMLIVNELVRQEAKANNIEVTEEEIDAELEKQAEASGTTVEDLLNSITQFYGVDEQYLRNDIEHTLRVKKLILPQVEITDEEVRQYYDDNIEQFTTPEQVRASHILVESKEEAEAIIAELQAGADFAQLAREKGTDGTAPNGGDLNYFGRGEMVKEFEDAVFAMEVGEITEQPVETQFGFHVIMKTDHKQPSVTDFEESEAQIRSRLEEGEISSRYQPWLMELRQNANIEYAEM